MTHLADYLKYYRTLDAPGYAVLVTGNWGVGKTHQVRQCIPEDECYYVSLFGLRTPDDAHAAVYAAYAPNLDRFGQGIGTIQDAAENAGGLISLAGAASGWLNAALRRQVESDRPLVFDDLERCGMSLEEMLGVFSTYTEHLGFQVVLIADEEKLIEKHSGYAVAKEKVVGHTTKIGPMASDGFDAFVSTVDEASRDYIQAKKPLVLEVFQASKCMSLRVLRHVVFDLARLHQALLPQHIKHEEAMNEAIGLFTACGIEVRLGRLKPTDLVNRAGERFDYEMRRHSAEKDEVEVPPLVDAQDRYPTIDLENQILSDQVLADVYEHGIFSRDRIMDSVNSSKHFVKPGDVPVWQLVSSFDELPEDVFQEALQTMNAQFDNQEITSSGDMLHIFALRLMMSDEGISGTDIDTTCAECIQYINDLLVAGQLPPRELDWKWQGTFDRSYGGHRYWVQSDYQSQFKTIRDRLVSAREEALATTYPEILAELLKLLKHDGSEFYRQLCDTVDRDSSYALIPILPSITPKDFVDAWLASPRQHWRWVSLALEDRLEPHRVEHKLAAERDWALAVLHELEGRRDTLTGFDQLRVARILPKKLRKLQIEEDDSAVAVNAGMAAEES